MKRPVELGRVLWQLAGGWAGAAVAYAFLTLALTFPTILNLSTSIVGYAQSDNIYSVWAGWWYKVALFDLHTSPASVPLLYYPLGLFQTMLTASPWTELTQAPLVAVASPVVAYNVVFLLSFFLTALSSYFLCRDITGNHWASLVGGFIFAFSPFRVIHAAAGHFTQSMTYAFPLYALFMLRVVRKPARRDAVLAGVFLALSSLVSLMHIAYFVIPFTIAVVLYSYFTDRAGFFSRARLAPLLTALGVGALLTAPFFLPFLAQRITDWHFLDRTGTFEYAVDPLAFISPSPYHPLFSRTPLEPFLQAVIAGFPFENLVYLGWVPLALAWYGRRGSTGKLWLWLGAVTALLSLGPVLRLGGELVGYQVEDLTAYILLPYALIKKLPLYEMGRTPARLVEPLMLCVAVLAALGLARLWQTRTDGRLGAWLGWLVLGVVIFEYITLWPLPMSPAPRPAFYEQIASDGQDYAIMDVPVTRREVLGESMYYQTIHGHPIVGGYLWRFPIGGWDHMEFMDSLAAAPDGPDIVSLNADLLPAAVIARSGVRYATIHKGLFESEGHERLYRASFTRTWGDPVYEDEAIAIFSVPPESQGLAGVDFGVVGGDWRELEEWEGVPTRWLSQKGTIFFLRSASGRYRLRFDAYPYLRNRHLQVLVNGKEIGTVTVSDLQTIELGPVSLTGGLNRVDFVAVDGCDRPSEVSGETDSRCLGIAVQNVRLVP